MNVAIVGAGLSGRLLAWQLLEAGCKVSLFDKDNGSGEQSAGFVAAAMLAPFSEALDAEQVVYDNGLAGLTVWQQWSKALLDATQINIDLNLSGSLLVSHRQDLGDYQLFSQRLSALEYVDQTSISHINREQLAELEPELANNFEKACYLEQEGALDNLALYQALAKRINDLGGCWYVEESIDRLQPLSDSDRFQAYDKVIDCRGFGAVAEVDNLRGVRGEVIRVKAPDVNLSRPVRLMHPRYKLYVCPKPNNEYVIGATQIESSSESAITVRSSLELLSALYSLHSGFAEAEILSQAARCRPAFMDNLPQVEWLSHRLLSVNGLYRHGYLLSPVLVREAVSEIIDSMNHPEQVRA